MKTEEGRRSFVRSMMVGVPAFAGSAALLPAAHAAPALARTTVTFADADENIDAVLTRMATMYNNLAGRVPTQADARRLATELRSLVRYRREAGRDTLVTGAFQQLIDSRGRETLAAMEPDLSRMRAGLVYYGIEPAAVTLVSSTREARLSALEVLARRGAEPFYDDAIGSMEDLEAVLSGARGLCDTVREMMNMFEAVAATMCLGSLIFPPMASECFAATVVLTALKLISLFMMC